MSEIQFVEVPFELGAGTVGASLGIEALKAAAVNRKSLIFHQYQATRLDVGFNFLKKDVEHAWAKYISRIREVVNNTSEAVAEVLTNGNFPVVLAGDHSTASGSIAGVLKAYPNDRLGVLWVDAHADLHSPYTSPSGNLHGMTLAIATGTDNVELSRREIREETREQWGSLKGVMPKNNKLSLSNIAFLGGREFEAEEVALCEKNSIPLFTVEEFRANPDSVIESIMEHFEACDRIYVTFDVDSMDPSVSMGTGTPVPGGFSLEEAIQINHLLLQNEKVCCWEMVEINPLLDSSNKMAEAGITILENIVSTLSDRLKN